MFLESITLRRKIDEKVLLCFAQYLLNPKIIN